MRQSIATKTCNTCYVELPIDAFCRKQPRKSGGYYYDNRCKTCKRTVQRERYAVDEVYREEMKSKARDYYSRPEARARTKEIRSTEEWRARDKVLRAKPERKASRKKYAQSQAGKSAFRRAYEKRFGNGYRGVPMRHYLVDCPEDQCYWCGCHITEDTRELEHVMPISKGGEAQPYNETWACVECNRGIGGKHSKHPLVWIAELVSR